MLPQENDNCTTLVFLFKNILFQFWLTAVNKQEVNFHFGLTKKGVGLKKIDKSDKNIARYQTCISHNSFTDRATKFKL